jgi:hypothetical protein
MFKWLHNLIFNYDWNKVIFEAEGAEDYSDSLHQPHKGRKI